MVNTGAALSQGVSQEGSQGASPLNELEMAKRVQQGLLGVTNPDIPGVSVFRRCIAANTVGGDFYTFSVNEFNAFSTRAPIKGVVSLHEEQNKQLSFSIGDVAGHGISSALVMALASGVLNEISHREFSPAKVLFQANNTLLKYIEQSQIRYLTTCYGTYSVGSRILSLSAAGHHPPLLIRDGQCEQLDISGVVLGMFESEHYDEIKRQLKPKDRLVLYTDGIIEAKNPKGEEFGFERLQDVLMDYRHHDNTTLGNQVYEVVRAFIQSEEAKDDQTLIIMDFD